jgi:hypothetical protein
MADPMSLAALGAVAITEGIKFVYGQASELLKRRRERKKTGVEPTEPVPIKNSEVLEGRLEPLKVDYEILEQVQGDMAALAFELADYKDGDVAPGPDVAEKVDELRRALEAVYGQRITFKGETHQESSGATLSGEARATLVKGLVAGVDVGSVSGGARVEGKATADTVGKEGELYGVRAKDVRG